MPENLTIEQLTSINPLIDLKEIDLLSALYCGGRKFDRYKEEFLIYRDTSVILDMEAGLEHLGRGTAQSMGTLVVVVEPGLRSVETARTVKRLASDLHIPVVKIVGNKVRNDADRQFLESSFPEDELLGCISYDERLIDADRDGLSPFDIGAERFGDEINAVVAALQSSSDSG